MNCHFCYKLIVDYFKHDKVTASFFSLREALPYFFLLSDFNAASSLVKHTLQSATYVSYIMLLKILCVRLFPLLFSFF